MNKDRLIYGLICCAGAAFGLFIFLFEPGSSRLFPPCLFHKLTGLYCPGCGSTRSLHSLLHGDFLQAINYNCAMIAFLPFLGILFFMYSWRVIKGKEFIAITPKPVLIWSIFAAIMVYWVLRNIPVYPFVLLAP